MTKFLVLALFVGRMRREPRLSPRDLTWIRWHLFEKGEYTDPDTAVRARYRDASRLASRYVRRLDRMAPQARLHDLRLFHRMAPQAKIACINAST